MRWNLTAGRSFKPIVIRADGGTGDRVSDVGARHLCMPPARAGSLMFHDEIILKQKGC
jgi:hypothetical protein